MDADAACFYPTSDVALEVVDQDVAGGVDVEALRLAAGCKHDGLVVAQVLAYPGALLRRDVGEVLRRARRQDHWIEPAVAEGPVEGQGAVARGQLAEELAVLLDCIPHDLVVHLSVVEPELQREPSVEVGHDTVEVEEEGSPAGKRAVTHGRGFCPSERRALRWRSPK